MLLLLGFRTRRCAFLVGVESVEEELGTIQMLVALKGTLEAVQRAQVERGLVIMVW